MLVAVGVDAMEMAGGGVGDYEQRGVCDTVGINRSDEGD